MTDELKDPSGSTTDHLVLGEVRTALLFSSSALPTESVIELLALVPGEPVRSRERPGRLSWSPDLLTGLDCRAPSADGRVLRVVGTALSRVSVASGQLLQASTCARVQPGADGRRHTWSHYLARPGVVEALSSVRVEDMATGFLTRDPAPDSLDVGAVNTRLLSQVQGSNRLDRRPPFRTLRTQMRWVRTAPLPGDGESFSFTVGADGVRSLHLRSRADDTREIENFCADLALHDWLLTALLAVVDSALTGSRPAPEVVRRLRPAVDHLVHAWMPGVRVSDDLQPLWRALEVRSGLSKQWQKNVERIRDQLSLSIVENMRGSD